MARVPLGKHACAERVLVPSLPMLVLWNLPMVAVQLVTFVWAERVPTLRLPMSADVREHWGCAVRPRHVCRGIVSASLRIMGVPPRIPMDSALEAPFVKVVCAWMKRAKAADIFAQKVHFATVKANAWNIHVSLSIPMVFAKIRL